MIMAEVTGLFLYYWYYWQRPPVLHCDRVCISSRFRDIRPQNSLTNTRTHTHTPTNESTNQHDGSQYPLAEVIINNNNNNNNDDDDNVWCCDKCANVFSAVRRHVHVQVKLELTTWRAVR